MKRIAFITGLDHIAHKQTHVLVSKYFPEISLSFFPHPLLARTPIGWCWVVAFWVRFACAHWTYCCESNSIRLWRYTEIFPGKILSHSHALSLSLFANVLNGNDNNAWNRNQRIYNVHCSSWLLWRCNANYIDMLETSMANDVTPFDQYFLSFNFDAQRS